VSTAVHHLNCASMAPLPSFGGRMVPARMVAHCLVVESADRLVLVDSGFGTADLASRRMGRAFIGAMRPALDPAETAVSQVRALGHEPADITDIVLTHMDLDHTGGLGDFPGARVHVFADELAAARKPPTMGEKQRYLPAQWAHRPNWIEHCVDGDPWNGFDSVQVLGDDVLMIPLRGHTRGHCGVAVRRPGGGWFLHAGDSYFYRGEKERPPSCPPGLAGFQSMVQVDSHARKDNQERLRSLHAEAGPDSGVAEPVTVFSAHDAAEYDDLAGGTD
jgi:glyoxylase-like metal-dependent hydrolase (beta-lactamase superfamily II)